LTTKVARALGRWLESAGVVAELTGHVLKY
jgi:hypothetical protein